MGFIYTGFRPSHFEVMAATDIKLVFIQILSYSQVTETIVFFKSLKKLLKSVCSSFPSRFLFLKFASIKNV